MSHYHHFTIQERESILLMLEQGKSLRSIAKALERSPSSVSRELKRNGMPSSMYSSEQAQKKCQSRVERKQLKNSTTEIVLCSKQNASSSIVLSATIVA